MGEAVGVSPDGDGVACVRCRYDLRGLSDEGACPECGLTVGVSRRRLDLANADPRWRRRVALGLRLFGGGAVFGAVYFLPDLWANLARMGDDAVAAVVSMVFFNQAVRTAAHYGTGLAIAAGFWLATSPQPWPGETSGRQSEVRGGRPGRDWIRWAALAAFAAAYAWRPMARWLGLGSIVPIWHLVPAAILLVFAAALHRFGQHTALLATRLGNPTLARRCRRGANAMVTLLLLRALALGLSLLVYTLDTTGQYGWAWDAAALLDRALRWLAVPATGVLAWGVWGVGRKV